MMQRRPGTGNLATLNVAVLITAITAAAAPAFAQPGEGRGPGAPRFGSGGGGGPFGELLRPDFLGRDMAMFREQLELDQPQAWIIETLLADYQADFEEAGARVREDLRGLRRTTGGPDAEATRQREQVNEQMRQIREELRILREKTPPGQPVDERMLQDIRARIAPLRKQMAEVRPPTPDPAQIEQMRKVSERWRAQRNVLRSEFLDSVRSILDERQLERWPDFERTLRRNKTLGRGVLSGEDVDLFLVVRELSMAPEQRAQLDSVLRQYAVALDEALAVRNEHLDSSSAERLAAMVGGDPERALALAAHEVDLRVAVRDVNDRFVESLATVIAEHVSAEQAEVLREEYRQRAFPRVYRTTRMQRALDAAAQLEGLDERTAGALAALAASYLVELEAANEQLEATMRAAEPAQLKDRQRRRASRFGDDEAAAAADPLRAAFQTRSDLDERYRAQLEALLTPEQVSMLPLGGRSAPGAGEDRGQRRQRWIDEFDADGDGRLDDQERQALRESRGARRRGGGDGLDPDDE